MNVVRGRFGTTPQQAGRDFEERWAERHGQDLQPASGATPRYKLDVGGRELLASLKKTSHASFRITADDVAEMVSGARGAGARDKTPVLVVELDGVDQPLWVMLESDALALAAGELALDLQPSRRRTKRAGAVPAILREEEDDRPAGA